MKLKIINEKLPLFSHILKVKSLNFDMVIAETETEKLALNIKDVKLISENKYEEHILSHKDILKIKLETEVSSMLYSTLIEYVEAQIGGKLLDLEVLRDEFKISKRGIYEKRLIIVVNNMIPIEAIITAMKYSKDFSITLKDMNLQQFINGCNEDIKLIKRDIEEKEKNVERHRHILKEVVKNNISSNNSQKLILA